MKDVQKIIKNEVMKLKKTVLEYKYTVESHIIGSIYQDKERLHQAELSLDDFNNNVWKVYFAIISTMTLKENKEIIDDININTFLEKHPKLNKKYEEYGGYQTVIDLKELIQKQNFDSYVEELHKWCTVLTLLDRGFIVDIKECIDMNLSEIYDLLETLLNDSFVKNTSDEISGVHDISDGIDELLEKLDKGMYVGLPYHNMPQLNNETGGMILSNLILVGGESGVGKSSFVRSAILPSIIDNDEKIVVILNEEDELRWKTEMLIWIANNVIKKPIQKYRTRDGNFTEEEWEILRESGKWLKSKKDKIFIIPFKKWRTSTAIKYIRKYKSMGVKYFVVDTLKLDSDSYGDQTWLSLTQNTVDLYDNIKKTDKNDGVSLICTFQLRKESHRRHYSLDSIGVAKNIVDVAGQCIMLRRVWEEEKKNGKYELKVFRLEGKTKIPIDLKEDKFFQLLFIIKNRYGATDPYQIMLEVDLSKNTYKEIGICWVESDY